MRTAADLFGAAIAMVGDGLGEAWDDVAGGGLAAGTALATATGDAAATGDETTTGLALAASDAAAAGLAAATGPAIDADGTTVTGVRLIVGSGRGALMALTAWLAGTYCGGNLTTIIQNGKVKKRKTAVQAIFVRRRRAGDSHRKTGANGQTRIEQMATPQGVRNQPYPRLALGPGDGAGVRYGAVQAGGTPSRWNVGVGWAG